MALFLRTRSCLRSSYVSSARELTSPPSPTWSASSTTIVSSDSVASEISGAVPSGSASAGGASTTTFSLGAALFGPLAFPAFLTFLNAMRAPAPPLVLVETITPFRAAGSGLDPSQK